MSIASFEGFCSLPACPSAQISIKTKLSCPVTFLDRPLGFQNVEDPRIYRQSAHQGGKVDSPTHRPSWPPGRIPSTHFCYRLSRPQGHNATGRVKSLKNSSDSIGNRTRDLSSCSAVPLTWRWVCKIGRMIPTRENLHLSQRRYVYHKSATDWPGIEPGYCTDRKLEIGSCLTGNKSHLYFKTQSLDTV
jgi:hypothetical protein